MKHFISIADVKDPFALARLALKIKEYPFGEPDLGRNKVLGLLFFNSSLRTRMSTTRAAYNLGLQVMTLNMTQDIWQLEMEDGTIMDQGAAEHVKEAIPVMSSYCDIIGVRSFPSLTNREEDYSEKVIESFRTHSKVPVVNMESATLHPLQSLADLMTIEEFKTKAKPKVVLTWAPHVKALPQAVANSFCQWMNHTDYDLVVTHPEGMELSEEFTGRAEVVYDQMAALNEADFVYVKNWSSYQEYGQLKTNAHDWAITLDKLKSTKDARLMHCLPVRRNLVISDDALDSPHSVIQEQAANRLYSTQAVLTEILKSNMG